MPLVDVAKADQMLSKAWHVEGMYLHTCRSSLLVEKQVDHSLALDLVRLVVGGVDEGGRKWAVCGVGLELCRTLSGTMFALAPESNIRDTFELVTEKALGAVMTVYDAN